MKNEIAVTDDTVKSSLMGMTQELSFFAPNHFDTAGWLQTAAMCVMESKKLRNALTTDKGKLSLVHALKYGITTGVSLNPQEGKAALIPFGDEVVFMVEKNGLCQMALDTGAVESIDADIVRSNDEFHIKKSSHGDDFEFSPARKDRGDVDGYFAFIQMKNGTSHVKYMTVEEITEWRDTKVPQDHLYRTYDDSYNTPPKFKKGDKIEDAFWWKSPNAAGLKTVIRQLLQNVHIPSIDKTFEYEDDVEKPVIRNVTPQKGTGSLDLTAKLAEKAAEEQETPPPAAPAPVITPEKKTTAGAPTTGQKPPEMATPASTGKPPVENSGQFDIF